MLRAVSVACSLLLVASLLHAADVRKWTDSTGKNTMQAEFVSLDAGMVTLKDSSGESFEIPLEKLSKADQEWIRKQEENPFKPKSSSPFKPKGNSEPRMASPSPSPSPSSSEAATAPVVVKVNYGSVQPVQPGDSDGWTYVPVADPRPCFKATDV